MAWIEKRKADDGTIRYRIRDWVNGKKMTVVKDAGRWKEIAQARLVDYNKSTAAGAGSAVLAAREMSIEEACDLFYERVGSHQRYPKNIFSRLGVIKRAWGARPLQEITKFDVGTLLADFQTTSTVLLYLATVTQMFHAFRDWNKTPKFLGFYVRLPPENPGTEWRAQMKPHQKNASPRKRVLSPEEWKHFRKFLVPKARAICEIALRRFLRPSDIRHLTHLSVVRGVIEGVQSKTGQPFRLPLLEGQPKRYDFRGFVYRFKQAQVLAGMDYPKDHPLHFSVRDLRRTGATWAYHQTKDLVGISRLLGHTNTKMTERYLHLKETDLSHITQAVDNVAGPRGAPVGQNYGNENK